VRRRINVGMVWQPLDGLFKLFEELKLCRGSIDAIRRMVKARGKVKQCEDGLDAISKMIEAMQAWYCTHVKCS
jgi:hypothetical protein